MPRSQCGPGLGGITSNEDPPCSTGESTVVLGLDIFPFYVLFPDNEKVLRDIQGNCVPSRGGAGQRLLCYLCEEPLFTEHIAGFGSGEGP